MAARALVLVAVLALTAAGPALVAPAWAQAPVTPAPTRPDPVAANAERAARAWLWLLDEQRYEEAWPRVAPAMRSLVAYEAWTTSLAHLRSGLPRVLRRELLRAERSVELFGGESVILSFRVGHGAREIVVMVERAGEWQVGGYGLLRT